MRTCGRDMKEAARAAGAGAPVLPPGARVNAPPNTSVTSDVHTCDSEKSEVRVRC